MVNKVDILAIGVHPDDIELGCAGTLFKHKSLGKSIALLDLTEGELGTRGSGGLRLEEANDAKNYLGVEYRENVKLADGFFQYNEVNIKKIIPFIRLFQPEIVLCNAINDRHPDHGRAAKLVEDACFYAGLAKVSTSYKDEVQLKWRPKAVYHYIQDYNLVPDFVVDITDQMEDKINMIMQYKSQFFDPNSKEPNTPISSASFLEFIKGKARTYGRHIGSDFGEGFTSSRYIGVKNLFDLL